MVYLVSYFFFLDCHYDYSTNSISIFIFFTFSHTSTFIFVFTLCFFCLSKPKWANQLKGTNENSNEYFEKEREINHRWSVCVLSCLVKSLSLQVFYQHRRLSPNERTICVFVFFVEEAYLIKQHNVRSMYSIYI